MKIANTLSIGIVLIIFSQPCYANDSAPNRVEGFLIFAFNSGAMLEFGDELLCLSYSYFSKLPSESVLDAEPYVTCRHIAREKILHTENHYPWTALFATLVGYVLFAPVSWLYFTLANRPESARALFSATLKFELIEGSICVIGQLLTDGSLKSAAFSIVIALVAGVIRGGALAFIVTWRKDNMFRIKSISMAALLSAGICYAIVNSSSAFAGGSGGALRKIFNEAAAPPQPNYNQYNLDYNAPGMGGNNNLMNDVYDTRYRTPISHTWHMPNVTPNSSPTQQFNGYSHGYK